MSRSNTILRNIGSNWIGFAVNAIVVLLLTPFVLRELGESRFGIWAITSSIIGYYGLLDFGVRGSINQFLTRFVAVGDYDAASGCMSTAIAALSAVGLACAALTVGAAYFAPQLLNFPAETEKEAFWCILIVGLTSSLQFGFFPFMSVFLATQRFDLANLIGVSTRLLSALLVYIALEEGYGLIGISVATCGASVVDYLVRWRVARQLLPALVVSTRRISRARLHELASFGVWTFLLSVNAFLFQHGQPLIIAALMPIAAVGYYALVVGLFQQIIGVLAPIGQVMYPVAAGMHAQGDRASLERLYHEGSRLIMLAMICVVLIAAFWAPDFYRLWIGDKYLDGSEYPSVALLLRLLLISIVSNYVSNIAAQILMGAGHVRPFALLLICGSILNIGLVLVLIRPYGLLGVATATVIASIVVDLIAIPIMLQRMLGLRVMDFVRKACARPTVVGMLFAIVLAGIARMAQPVDWLDLILQGLLAGVSAVALVLAVGINSEERRRLILQPLNDLLGRK